MTVIVGFYIPSITIMVYLANKIDHYMPFVPYKKYTMVAFQNRQIRRYRRSGHSSESGSGLYLTDFGIAKRAPGESGSRYRRERMSQRSGKAGRKRVRRR